MKRVLDLTIIILLAPIWVPVAAIVALLVWANLGRPVFFVQDRAGLNGRPFTLYKFRTMRTGEGSDAERLTRLGRFLRAASLDEIPGLWSVLKGEMSLVGPRPLPVRYLSRYTPEQNRRHEVLPGITGWAQVNGRNTLDWETKFRYDVEYVERRSFGFDLKILWMTFTQVIVGKDISHDGEATMSEFEGEREEGRGKRG